MIKKEDIVTVIGKNEFTDCQGIVIRSDGKNKKYPIVVLFKDRMYDVHFSFNTSPDERTHNFKESELRVDSEWKLEVRAKRVFGDSFHSLFSAKKGSNPKNNCHASNFDSLRGCEGSSATKKALVNFAGSIYEIKMCDACFERYHGHCIE